MRHKLSYLILVILVAAMALTTGCSSDELVGPGGDQGGPAPAKIWIEGPLAVTIGKTAQLTAFILEQDGTKREITTEAGWAMSDPARVSVDKGFVTTKALGRSDIHLTYRGTTFVDPFFIKKDRRGGSVAFVELDGYDPLKQVVQFSTGETRQLKATVRLPDATSIDVTDRLIWKNANPASISVTDMGLAEVRVAQGASELYVNWRGAFGIYKLQVGSPLPKEYDVTVEAFRIKAPFSCDSATNLDGGDGEFSYEINVITPAGQRLLVSGTNNYPDENEVVHIDQNGTKNISGSVSLKLSDIQALEVEVRLTEWDLTWTDFGKPIADTDMDDRTETSIYRGGEGFTPGLKTIVLRGPSGDCEVEVEYYVIAVQ